MMFSEYLKKPHLTVREVVDDFIEYQYQNIITEEADLDADLNKLLNFEEEPVDDSMGSSSIEGSNNESFDDEINQSFDNDISDDSFEFDGDDLSSTKFDDLIDDKSVNLNSDGLGDGENSTADVLDMNNQAQVEFQSKIDQLLKLKQIILNLSVVISDKKLIHLKTDISNLLSTIADEGESILTRADLGEINKDIDTIIKYVSSEVETIVSAQKNDSAR